MKNRLIFLTIILLALCFVFSAFYFPPTSVGVLTKIIKQVDYKAFQTAEWDDAKNGSVLYDGDEIKTGNRSLALIKFLDNSLLRIRENSIVTVMGIKENNKINKNAVIQEGTIGFEIEEQGDAEFKFTTPTAVASIRGTEGYLTVDELFTMLFVGSGAVEMQASGDGISGMINENEVGTIGPDGELIIRDATDAEKEKFNSITKDNINRIKIRTESGEEYIIEYLD